ncbi:hypothetical protein LC040_01565 [Bacillus tianshenii]|nr:hypothetical protein LC040_01565 [Bacillus tianshenii]
MSIENSSKIDNKEELVKINELLREAEDKLVQLKNEASESNSKKLFLSKPSKILSFDSYFQYSTILPSSSEELSQTFILGNLHLINTGTKTLTNPVICLKISPPAKVALSGKISYGKGKNLDELIYQSNEEWTYVEYDWRKKTRQDGEHWLRPLHCPRLEQGETLTFSNFHIRLSENIGEEVRIEGYVYCQEDSQGKAALNTISLQFPST